MQKALYAAYFTGNHGNSIGLFYIDDANLLGIDVGGMKYDGRLEINEGGGLSGVVQFVMPAEAQLVTGVAGRGTPTKIQVPLKLPQNFDDGRVLRIDTPVGAVNVRFEKIRELP